MAEAVAEDFYVIVHAGKSELAEFPEVAREIRKVKRRNPGKYHSLRGNPCAVDYGVPEGSNVFVCGFYHGKEDWDPRCVDEQVKALKRIGVDAEIYLPATVSLKY